MSKKKVVIGMSGGVDSSVAAWMLKEQGYEVIGLFMKNWEDDDDSEYCSTRQDWIDAASVADVVGVDIEAVNFAAEYKDRVFAEFLREYQAGRTPNPDVLCNAEIKFKAFLDHAMKLGADLIATGHYARVRQNGGKFELLKAFDHTKDQSYFLHRLNQAQLSKSLFPLGEIPRPKCARSPKAAAAERGEEGFDRHLLHRRAPVPRIPEPLPVAQAGPDQARQRQDGGRARRPVVLHAGPAQGHRHRRLKSHKNADGTSEPWFVARKDIANNTLYIVQGHDHPWLLSPPGAGQASWVAGEAPAPGCCRPRRATARPTWRARSRRGLDRFRAALRRAAVGGDAGAVGGAV
jgi:tRNA-specific 2-thiouridylase